MLDPRPAYGYTELTSHLARRMGQLWAARQVSKYAGDRSLLLDALTLPTGPPADPLRVSQRWRAYLRTLHRSA